jgi:hypothetical protein
MKNKKIEGFISYSIKVNSIFGGKLLADCPTYGVVNGELVIDGYDCDEY